MGARNSKKDDKSSGPSFEVLASGTSLSCYCCSYMVCCVWVILMLIWGMAQMQVFSEGAKVVSKNPELLKLVL